MRDKTFGSQNRDISRLQSHTATQQLPGKKKQKGNGKPTKQSIALKRNSNAHPVTGAGKSGQTGRQTATTQNQGNAMTGGEKG
jgi:hypothetical protein